MARHIFSGSGAPATAPAGIGHHYIDTLNKESYISVGTATSADWKSSAGGGIADTGDYSSPELISSTIAIPSDPRARMFVVGDSGPSVDPTLGSGNGTQELYLVGTDDTDSVALHSTTNLTLSGAIFLKAGTVLALQWMPVISKWIEVSRNEL